MVASSTPETVGRRSWIQGSAGGKRREEIFFNLWKFYPAKALERRAFQAIAVPALRRVSRRERTPRNGIRPVEKPGDLQYDEDPCTRVRSTR